MDGKPCYDTFDGIGCKLISTVNKSTFGRIVLKKLFNPKRVRRENAAKLLCRCRWKEELLTSTPTPKIDNGIQKIELMIDLIDQRNPKSTKVEAGPQIRRKWYDGQTPAPPIGSSPEIRISNAPPFSNHRMNCKILYSESPTSH